MAETIGDDETYSRGIEKARAALGRTRPRPRAVPDLEPDDVTDIRDPDGPEPDERDERIAQLEAEVRHLRAALARIHRESDTALD